MRIATCFFETYTENRMPIAARLRDVDIARYLSSTGEIRVNTGNVYCLSNGEADFPHWKGSFSR